MKNLAITFAFIDVLFNLLLGITVLFITAFLLINPPTTNGEVDPPVTLMIEMEWDNESLADIDMWVRGHEGRWVGFRRLDGNYYSLQRDDRGTQNDTIWVNGEMKVIKRNYEVVNFTILPPGEYYVNVHHFSTSNLKEQEEVNIRITNLEPFAPVYEGTVTVRPRQEVTSVSFVVDLDGKIQDVRTDVQLTYVGTGGAGAVPMPAGEDPW